MYQQPTYNQPQQQPSATHDGMAIASLVLSLVWLWGLGSLLAVIFGHISHKEAKRLHRQPSGMATAGLVIGYLGLGVALLVTILIVVALSKTSSYQDCLNNWSNSGVDPSIMCNP